MRRDIEFSNDGITLRGWLYVPDAGSGPYPAVVMSHGFTGLKEMSLDRYGEAFSNAGLAVLVFDNRCLGASDGQPRHHVDHVAQFRDYRAAVSFAGAQPEVDAARIGAWGTSYTGGTVLKLAAIDRRVRCVVSQVPLVSGLESIAALLPLSALRDFHAMIDADRERRMAGEPSQYVQVCSNDPAEPAVFPGTSTYEYFHRMMAEVPGMNWENKCTIASLEQLLEYDVAGFMGKISPAPMMMIVSEYDTTTPTDIAIRAFQLAAEPKRLVVVKDDHYAAYLDGFEETSAAARDWFLDHL